MTLNVEAVEALTANLTLREQYQLSQMLRDALVKAPVKQAKSLRGIWKGAFPEDFDIDAALKEIRSEWLEELDEFKP